MCSFPWISLRRYFSLSFGKFFIIFRRLPSVNIRRQDIPQCHTYQNYSQKKSISAIYKNSFSSCHSPALVSCIELLSSLWNAPSEMSILFFTLFIHWNCQPVFLIHVLCRSKVIHFVQECLGILGSASLETVNSK